MGVVVKRAAFMVQLKLKERNFESRHMMSDFELTQRYLFNFGNAHNDSDVKMKSSYHIRTTQDCGTKDDNDGERYYDFFPLNSLLVFNLLTVYRCQCFYNLLGFYTVDHMTMPVMRH